jgi:peptide/nickel transport system ATP-binding protein
MAARRPHELSGGQRQRVAIARALAPGAQVLIADEPVSMLDVSIRLGVLNLLGRLQREDNLAVLYITHDLATARHFSDEILVLYRGRVVERGPSDAVILDPHHDYTKLLAMAAPDPDRVGSVGREGDTAVARDGIDNSVCYDHALGAWVPIDEAEAAARAATAGGVRAGA